MKELKQGDYNDREFLACNSVRSCASYHAKVVEYQGETKLLFRVNDCNKGALLINRANVPEERAEMIEKLMALAYGATAFAAYLDELDSVE